MLQLSTTLKALSLQVYLISTGTTSPVTADEYYINGLYGGIVYYVGVSTSQYIWTDGVHWNITTTSPGTIPNSGTSYFQTASGATSVGPYVLQANSGSGSGTPVVVAHGNAVLAGFQPETVNITGSIGSVSNVVTANVTEVGGSAITGGILQTADLTAIVNAIMAYAVETGVSFELAVQKMAAVIAGNYSGTTAGGVFQSVGGTTTRVQTSISGTNRTNV